MSSSRVFGPIQLARWLGLTNDQFRRALHRGLIPPPDIDDSKWSQDLAKTLPDQIDGIQRELESTEPETAPHSPEPTPAQPTKAKKKPNKRDSYGSIQLARLMGLKEWQVRRAKDRGLIPAPDIDDRRWSREIAESLPGRTADVLSEIGDHPGLGSQKAADRLSERTGLPVTREDVHELAAKTALHPVGDYMGSPLYSMGDLDILAQDQIQTVIDDRRTWIANSLTAQEAADHLGWPLGVFEVTAERAGLTPGRLDRYPRVDIQRLARPDTSS
ncbi:hypothetical protein KGD82_27560 (plasmid) [Nocardiopsis eucommiae]|uniref:Uncharacterized protein n=1 Tax=Nocardiopsis eucommiae TaxID=2831970 RepID=A0A975LCN7_9ACTN|nr:hypothetical protein KGD82_27560 [Nocardiopsis eucommiae]